MSIITISTRSDSNVAPTSLSSNERPLCLCIAGQSGAGKSTVLRMLAEVVAERRNNVVILDEKALHHPYIDRLFVAPDRYAFELQLQFMVSRALFVKRWMDSGYSVVMERSHAEDPVFIRHLLAFKHVNEAEHEAYMSVWASLASRIPMPDLLVFLEVPIEVSVQRLSRPEAAVERPHFPDEAARRAWIASWNHFYRQRFDELQSDPEGGPRVLRFDYPVSTLLVRNTVAHYLDTLVE